MLSKSKLGWSAVVASASVWCASVEVQAQAAQTSTPVAVLELFTSQGCSSCPAADALLKSYLGRRDLIALSFSVDYWDYLGWKDTLASPAFTKRQRAYAIIRGDGQVYTPQAVLNGRAHVVGSSVRDVDAAIKVAHAEAAKQWVPVAISVTAGDTSIELGAAVTKPVTESTVWFAVVQPEVTVAVRGGENGGRKLTYHNVVRQLSSVGSWSGSAATIKVPASAGQRAPDQRIVVILQDSQNGIILGAAQL